MGNLRYFFRLDFRFFPILISLMTISLFVLSSMTRTIGDLGEEAFFTPLVKSQLEWFLLGWGVFFFFSAFDYRKFFNWAGILYVIMVIVLLGLYLTQPIQSVHRWYRIPWLGISFQPSEGAKLILILTLAWFFERKKEELFRLSTALEMLFLMGIPFFLILKQPDLGTALVFYPIVLVMGYFAGIHRRFFLGFAWGGALLFLVVSLIFSGVISHEKAKPFFTSFMKEYQYERLNPHSYHQQAAKTALALGGWTGKGWKKSEYSGHKWLPAAHTDSVFAAFGEEFGLMGILFLLFLFYSLLYLSFQIVLHAKDLFGRLLASGIAIYLAMHMIGNMAMMVGFLPIAGVPLPLISYGGSAVLVTMASLGILQSIYIRRFTF